MSSASSPPPGAPRSSDAASRPALDAALDWARRHLAWVLVGAAVVVGLGLVALLSRSSSPAASQTVVPAGDEARASSGEQPAPPEPPAAPQPETAAPAGSNPAGSGAPAPPAPVAAVDAGVRSATVKVVFKVVPHRRATVTWGSKRLGVIERGGSLEVERPRDSGPLDVVIRAPGYIPVHTRAYTFDHSLVEVRLTRVDKKDTIYGYKEPLPPPDAGVPLPPP